MKNYVVMFVYAQRDAQAHTSSDSETVSGVPMYTDKTEYCADLLVVEFMWCMGVSRGREGPAEVTRLAATREEKLRPGLGSWKGSEMTRGCERQNE